VLTTLADVVITPLVPCLTYLAPVLAKDGTFISYFAAMFLWTTSPLFLIPEAITVALDLIIEPSLVDPHEKAPARRLF